MKVVIFCNVDNSTASMTRDSRRLVGPLKQSRVQHQSAVVWCLHERAQALDNSIPSVRQLGQVVACLTEGLGSHIPDALAAMAVAADQPGRLQGEQVFGDGLAAHRNRVAELSDR